MSFHRNERRALSRQASDTHRRQVEEKHPIVLSAVCSLTVADGDKVRRRRVVIVLAGRSDLRGGPTPGLGRERGRVDEVSREVLQAGA